MIEMFYPLFFFTLCLLVICVALIGALGVVLWWSERELH
jgi:hypothetical protein